MQVSDFVDECEPDSAPFVRSRALVGCAPEALEDFPAVFLIEADTAVRYRKPHRSGIPLECYGYGAFEGKLQGIREQIEHGVFPQACVDHHAIGQP